MSKHIELVTKLREIFQIDRPDLDFGIYRILNTRAAEINAYLEQRLPEKVKAALAQGGAAQQEQVARELQEKEAQYQADGIDPGTVPKVRELREKLAQYQAGASEHENAVFSHLLAFFSRYYKDGDFISQRRYKGDTYAIPYAGEEVMLHWANKDQYYTKSSENFANYSFKLDDGRTVHFRLVAADTAKDNRKDNDKERRFALIAMKKVTRVNDQGDEDEEALLPVEEVDRLSGTELVVRFEYAPQPKGTRQDALVQKAVAAVLADDAVKSRWLALGGRAPTEKNPQRTLLEKHLSDYTTKNTADYFIHKDLGGFLRRELDFYIKNEVMNLDDVQNASAFGDIEKSLRMIQCLRAIAQEIIEFLAQLENFQKRMWLKKKFVASTNYCVTLDRISEDLFSDIAANPLQWSQWHELGMRESPAAGNLEELRKSPYLMVDTSLYSSELKAKLLRNIDDLDDFIDGMIVHSDNLQALRLLSERIREQVDCFYLDPPYNTESNPIIYKNSYQHSTWLSLMQSRLEISSRLERPAEGVHILAIDAAEMDRLSLLIQEVFPTRHCEPVSVIHNPGGTIGKNFSTTGEYSLFVYDDSIELLSKEVREDDPDVRDLMNTAKGASGNYLRATGRTCFYPILVKNDEIVGFGDVCEDSFHPTRNVRRPDGIVEVYPIDNDGVERKWVLGRATVESCKSELFVKKDRRTGEARIERRKTRINYKTVWTDGKYSAKKYGTEWLGNMIPATRGMERIYPKSINLVKDCLFAAVGERRSALIFDYFAGSGTTGEGVIAINRTDGGKRRYILAEQGEYFKSILKPRIQKAVFSTQWADGKPLALTSGISHCFKVLQLESYEDTLNNLKLDRGSDQDDLFAKLPVSAKDDYLLNYMLDVESRESLLTVRDFTRPFDYALNIAVDSAGASETVRVDLVETFNYLLGLRVKQIDTQPERGFVTVTGALPSGETCLVLWRDCEKLDYEGITKLCDKLAINPADNEYDVVYINGDHNIPTVLTQTAEEGGATRVLKLRQIEPEFLERMFSTEDV
jgi:adenine-specific DNA-methyltransferase